MTQPDTIVPGYANPQNLNRYSYVRNNPLRYTDPTGHWIDEGGGFATNKTKNGRLRIVSGRRVGNSDGDGVFVPPPPLPAPTKTETVTPTPSPTSCPQAEIACLPTATGTPYPTPTATPNTGPTIGAAPSSANPHNWGDMFESWREYFGLIDMFQPGPLTGANINPISAYVH